MRNKTLTHSGTPKSVKAKGSPVRIEVTEHSPYSQQENFKTILGLDLRILFPGLGPLPAVVGTEDEQGSWDHVGATRRPRLSDRSSAMEALTEVNAPDSFSYDITRITGLLGSLTGRVHSTWTMTPEHRGTYAGGNNAGGTHLGGTTVTWSYDVYPRPYRRLPLLAFAPAWKMYMRRSLRSALDEVARQAGS